VSYPGVLRVARERPNLLPLVVEAHRYVKMNGNHFSGRDVLAAAQWPTSNLLPLAQRGVIEKIEGDRNGRSIG
jgi:hypothetical protein